MKRIFALGLVIALLAVVVAPQVEAVSWRTYKDPKGRFSMKYPADWDFSEIEVDLGELGTSITVVFEGPDDSTCAAIITKNLVPFMKGKWLDETDREGDETVRLINFSGKKYAGIFTFTAPSNNFDSANKNYFGPRIRSIKVN